MNERFSNKPVLSTLFTTIEARKSHAGMHEVCSNAIPRKGCGLDHMNWQEVVKLLHDVLAYSDIQVVVYTLKGHGVDALSTESGLEFHANDEMEQYSEILHLNEKDLETDFTRLKIFPIPL